MTQPNYLDNHLYVLGGDLKQFRRHLFQMVDDLVFVTRHGALRNLRTMAKATRARAYLWKHPGPRQRRVRRIAFITFVSAGVVAGLAVARSASVASAQHRVFNRRQK